MAREAGFSELKFFPADLMGGVGWLNHIYPLYPDLGFCPTGGISDANSRDYLALPNVLAVGGAFLAPRSLIESADWRAISEQASRSVELVRS
jgi:2-dehydro-3-deoxyphosphogluconate aldolase/(4S)-4-hydroxy-2-oxoglutarate aldolase